MQKRILLINALLLSTFLNVNATIHLHTASNGFSFSPALTSDCHPLCMAGAGGATGNGVTSFFADDFVIVCTDGSGEPSLSDMTQSDFENLVRSVFAEDGIKIQDLTPEVSQAVLDALNQGQLKIDFEEV